MSLSSQETCAAIYKQLFTDAEWQIIDEALSEYQDHLGEDVEQEQNYYSLQAKIYAIFQLTKWESSSSLLLLFLVQILALSC